jgi:Ca-activated chloride channel family protein
MRSPELSLAAIAVMAASFVVLAQSPIEPVVRIVSPAEGTHVSGPTRLVVVVDPPSAARQVKQVVIQVGGKNVCTVSRAPYECDWDAGATIIEHMIRAVVTFDNIPRAVGNRRTSGLTINEAVDVDAIQVTAVVTDRNERFVTGLTQKDFKIFEDDRPQAVTNFAAEDASLQMVLALDVSSSMRDAMPHVREGAKQFVAGLRASDHVTLLAFNEEVWPIGIRAKDRAELIRGIDLLKGWGGTALYDVIIDSLKRLGRRPGRKSLLLFSDGDDQNSHATLEAARAAVEGSDATVYVIGQGRAIRAKELQTLLDDVSKVSGGRAFFTESPDKLEGHFKEILEDLSHQYLLGYEPPSPRDGKYHSIRVETTNDRYKVRARQGYKLSKN